MVATVEQSFLHELGLGAPTAVPVPSAPPSDDNPALWTEPESTALATDLLALIDEVDVTAKRITEGERHIADLVAARKPVPNTWQIRLTALTDRRAALPGQIVQKRAAVAELAVKLSKRLTEQWDWLATTTPRSVPTEGPHADPRFRDAVSECLAMSDAEFTELVRDEAWFAAHQPGIEDGPLVAAAIAHATPLRSDPADREGIWLRILAAYGRLCDAVIAAAPLAVGSSDTEDIAELSWTRAWEQLRELGFKERREVATAIGGWDGSNPQEVVRRARAARSHKPTTPLPPEPPPMTISGIKETMNLIAEQTGLPVQFDSGGNQIRQKWD